MKTKTLIRLSSIIITLTGMEIKVVLACLKFWDEKTNEIILSPARRQEISDTLLTSRHVLDNIVSRLYKKLVFLRENGSIYLNL